MENKIIIYLSLSVRLRERERNISLVENSKNEKKNFKENTHKLLF